MSSVPFISGWLCTERRSGLRKSLFVGPERRLFELQKSVPNGAEYCKWSKMK